MASTLHKYLADRVSEASMGDDSWEKVNSLYTQKLWHELSLELLLLLDNKVFEQMSEEDAVKFHDEFMVKLQPKINSITYANISIKCAEKMRDPKEAILFLEQLSKSFAKDQFPAKLSVLLKIAQAKLAMQDFNGCKLVLDDTRDSVENRDDISLKIHADYFKTSADYNKAKLEFSKFYRNMLRSLGCLDIEKMTASEQQQVACDLAISALVAKDIYNFGELLNHPILNKLKNTSFEWLHILLYSFNRGDVSALEKHQQKWINIPEIANNYSNITLKISIMCLLEIIFQHSTDDRVLSYDELATKLGISHDEVENLFMKSLSLGLVKGSIDGIAKKVTITWIQPRVLDFNQIQRMTEQLGDWCSKVENTLKITKSEHGSELV